MALAGKIAANTVIQVATKVMSTALSLVAMAMITRYLGQYGFGQFTTAVTFVTFFSIASDLGITLVTTQLISRPGVDINRTLGNLFAFRLVTAAIIIALAPLTVHFFPYEGVIKQGVAIAGLAFFFVIMTQIFVSLFQRELRTDRIAIAEFIGRVVVLVATAGAIYLDWGVAGVLWAMAAANAASYLFHHIFARTYVRLRLRFDWGMWRDIMSRSWPLVITIVMNLIYLKTDTLLLSLLKTQQEVGLYGAAYRVIDVLVTVPFMIGGTVLPVLAMRWQGGDRAHYQRAWQKVFDASMMIAAPLVAGGFVLATPIMRLVAGDEFIAAGPILQILIFAVGCVFLSAFFSYTMLSFERQRVMIPAYIITAILSLVLYLTLIPRFSYFAAAGITVFSELLISLLAWRLVRRESKLRLDLKAFGKTILAAVVMGVCIYVFKLPTANFWQLALTIIIGGLIYGGILYASGGVTKADLQAVFKRPKTIA